ncbi:MAG: cytochrome-c oxidase, cbb3-type subunit II [Burkholderiales bacterium]|jgi:cytochrome c oxidase cbb3-type subunit 2|nr:cytochrome-c oxidase, cbb3-type subunit II [Burkholderiales bacterium]
MSFFSHKTIETKLPLMIVAVLIAVSIGGLVLNTPIFFQDSTTKPVEGLKPLTALQLEGRDIYVREGCYNCHTQQVRPFRSEFERYGHYSVAGEFVYDRPHQWGSRRTGPDLAREGGRYSDEWQRLHLRSPRSLVGESNMPNYPWLQNAQADAGSIAARMGVLRLLGVPYTDAEIDAAANELQGKTEEDALVAYLQTLGTVLKSVR